ncbi:MAG: tetratricopeptide repeat protein [Thermodesulfobacteriota bacterium]
MDILKLAMVALLTALLCACAPKKASPRADMSAKGLQPAAAADYYYLLYQDLSRRGQVKDAVTALEKLLEIEQTPELYRDLANLHWGLGDPGKTREILKEGIARFPGEKVLHFYMANSYVLQRQYDEAAAVLAQYLANNPKDTAASQELGAVLVEAGRFQDALDFLSRIPRDRRTPAMAYYESKALAGTGKARPAIEKLRQALREDPNMLAAWSELAFHHEQNGEYRQAEEAYRRILDLGEDGPEVWIRLVRLALKQKDEAKALTLLDKGPKDRAYLFEVMGLLMDEGFQDAAGKVLERLAKEQPGNADVIFIQAMLAVEKEKDLDKAFDLLAQIPKGHKFHDKSLTTRVQLAIDAQRYDRALPLIAEGKTLYPDRIDFWFLEAVMYDKQGNLPKAAEVYWVATGKWPGNTEALYRYATVLERMGNRAEALAIMERVLGMEPDNADALNFVGYALAEDGRDLDRALDLILKALAQKPDSPYFIDSLAWVHFKRGDIKQAWTEIQRATSKPQQDPAIWEHYGDIAKALGKRKEAARGYAKALEFKPANAAEVKAKLDGVK